MSAPVEHVAAVVLAAGEAKRFGSQKLLASFRGRPLLQYAVDSANASSLDPVVVVLGADADAIQSRIALGRARVTRNAEYATGQASSLRAGIRELRADVDAAVVILGDQPLVNAALLDALVREQRETKAIAVVCAQDGRRSPPALLCRELWDEVESLRGDVGAREILVGRPGIAVLTVDATLARLDDIDTPEGVVRRSNPS